MRIVSVYPSASYNECGHHEFELRNGDLFTWNNCIMQVEDVWGNNSWGDGYDATMAGRGLVVTCSIKSAIASSFGYFNRDSGLHEGKRIQFPLEFVAVAVNRRFIPPPPEPPPPPPPEPKTKFETLADES